MPIGIYKRNPEQGKKHSQWMKNYSPKYWLGKKRSQEDKMKMREAKLGKNTNNWRGGITPVREKIRKMLEYRQWRYDCFAKDNFTCVECNKRGGELTVDHSPIMFAQILDEYKILNLNQARECKELWNIHNGRVLCVRCHKKTFTGVPKKPWQNSK